MKKILYTIMLFLVCIGITNAAKCNVVSGTGKNIGDEIACGTEHFYVISNDGTNVKMLAKYNLLVGYTYERIEEKYTSLTVEEAENYCLTTYGEEYYAYSPDADENGAGEYICYKESALEFEIVKQDKTAIGAHGTEEGKPANTEVGIIWFDAYSIASSGVTEAIESNYAYYNYEFSDEEITGYFTDYKKTLTDSGYNINNINLMTIEDINEIVKKVTGNELPLETWAEESWEKIISNSLFEDSTYKVGSLKDYVSNEYSWLWSTTYWFQTMYVTDYRENSWVDGYIYFTDTLGNVCAEYNCPMAVGAGIRPVVTIAADDLIYNIQTKTDGNGTIESTHVHAEKGEIIKFVITPNEGYVLSEVKVTDEKGNVITFTENTFTMPEANVTIEATFTVENSETSTSNIIIATILLIISCTIFYKFKKKANWVEV